MPFGVKVRSADETPANVGTDIAEPAERGAEADPRRIDASTGIAELNVDDVEHDAGDAAHEHGSSERDAPRTAVMHDGRRHDGESGEDGGDDENTERAVADGVTPEQIVEDVRESGGSSDGADDGKHET